MSHNIETMAYTNEVPWHGLGVRVDKAPNVAEMIKLAGLDWQVHRQPLFYTNDAFAEKVTKAGKAQAVIEKSRHVEGFAALVRDKDGKVFDVVGSRYMPVQPSEAFEFFTEFVEAGDATMETAGSLRGGQYIWGLAKLGDSFTLKGKDKTLGYILVGCPYEQGKSFIIKPTCVRVVCNNTLTMALRAGGDDFRMSHRVKFDKAMIKRAKETLGIAREQFHEFEETAQKLQKMKLAREDVLQILRPVFAKDVTDADWDSDDLPPRLEKIMDCYKNAPGAEVGTGWGVLNAVTYYADHVASLTADKRLTNAWFGRTANQKQRVMADLLAA